LGLLVLLVPSVRQRLFVAASQSYLVDSAIDGRIWAFNDAVEVFKTSPLVGTGPGTYGGQTAIYYNSPVYLRGMQNGYVALPYTDNQWLQIFVQVGIVGILTIIGFFVSHLTNNLRQYIRSGNYINLGVIAATIAIIVNGFFANIWEFGAISVLAGAYLGLGNNHER
jgi:O-antigen ligase